MTKRDFENLVTVLHEHGFTKSITISIMIGLKSFEQRINIDKVEKFYDKINKVKL